MVASLRFEMNWAMPVIRLPMSEMSVDTSDKTALNAPTVIFPAVINRIARKQDAILAKLEIKELPQLRIVLLR